MNKILTDDVKKYLSSIDNILETNDYTTYHYIPSNYSKKNKEDTLYDITLDTVKELEQVVWKKYSNNNIVPDKHVYLVGIDCSGDDDDNTKYADSVFAVLTPEITSHVTKTILNKNSQLTREVLMEYFLQQSLVEKLINKYSLEFLPEYNLYGAITGHTEQGLGFSSKKLHKIEDVKTIFPAIDEFFDTIHSKDYADRISNIKILTENQFYDND